MRSRVNVPVVSVALAILALAPARAQQALPGTDIRSWAAADITSRLSFAGTWTPMDSTAQFAGPFWDVVKLGPEQREGLALAGWVYNGSFQSTLPDTTPTRAALFAQQADGTLADAAGMLEDATTAGTGSVIAADFNGDGRDDVVFSAHNESPFFFKSSVAFMSRPDGSLSRLVVNDSVMNHDAQLYRTNGVNKIISHSFGTQARVAPETPFHVVYTWNGTNFTVAKFPDQAGGMSAVAGPFGSDRTEWMAVSDRTLQMLPFAFRYSNDVLDRPPLPLPAPYFNGKAEYAGFTSQFDPNAKTHTVRLKAVDLNQDGRLDILAVSTLWYNHRDGHQKGVYQQLINRGNMVFSDDTDALTPASEISRDIQVDYSVRLADVDASGIETIFAGSGLTSYSPSNDAQKQGQFIIVNDGTGRLYSAMHAEFRAMTAQIAAFARPRLPQGTGYDAAMTPQYLAYRTPQGTINFLAVLRLGKSDSMVQRFAFVNVPLGINLTTDFRRDLIVGTRNGSRRIRTFAGNDTIHRTSVDDPDCTIDGGLGTNVAVYPGPRSAWSAVRGAGGTVIIRPAQGAGGVDTLTRVHIARFADGDVDLTQ